MRDKNQIVPLVLLCLVCSWALAQSGAYIGAYGTLSSPLTGQERVPCTFGTDPTSPTSSRVYSCTVAQMLQYVVTNGTLVTQTVLGQAITLANGSSISCTGTGVCNANEFMGYAPPIGCPTLGTGSDGHLICDFGISWTPTTYAAIGTCQSSLNGTAFWITDSPVNAYNGTITTGGGSNKVLAICNGTNWTAH